MIGKLIDVTNFNRQEAVEFIRMRCTDCDIYYFCNDADAEICNDKVDYLLEKFGRKSKGELIMKIETLKDTVEPMCSEDYKERFIAEYAQLVIRYKGLQGMLKKWDDGTLEFEPTCPRSVYNMQTKAMSEYIAVLEARAAIENVDLIPE